jgi:hypothetical protein
MSRDISLFENQGCFLGHLRTQTHEVKFIVYLFYLLRIDRKN